MSQSHLADGMSWPSRFAAAALAVVPEAHISASIAIRCSIPYFALYLEENPIPAEVRCLTRY